VKSEKIEVDDIDVTRTSPESKSAGGEFTRTTGLGAILCRVVAICISTFEKSRFCILQRVVGSYSRVVFSGSSTAGATAIVHFGSVGRLCGLFERSKAT
jgi:hypothetical protein